ncbi:hypothetical protein HY989_02735 [Candidatus Micrarchaeota archaeon]|nr:hypothetical protein [Candidatus Micrarchaeota archaeon]
MRAQTAIEYLLLIGATVFFVIMVALATRDILLPTGKTILLKQNAVDDGISNFGASPTPIASICTPFEICTTNLNCLGSCASDGSYCIDNPSDNCPATATSNPPTCVVGTTENCNTVISGQTCPGIQTCQSSQTWGACADLSDNCPVVATPVCISGRTRPCTSIINGQTCPGLETCSNARIWGTCVDAVDNCPLAVPDTCTISGAPPIAVGPFTSAITATFTGNFGQNALIKCNDTDVGESIHINPSTGIAKKDCDYINQTISNKIYNISAASNGIACNSTITDLKPLLPFCKITANPASGFGPFISTIVANFSGTNHSINVTIKCNQTDLGVSNQINFISRLALRNCPYPDSLPINQTFNISASSNAVFCNGTVVVNQTSPQQCKLSASPFSDIGPFTSVLTANFSGTNNGPNALIKCNQSDPGISVPIPPATRIATRTCPYPSVYTTSQIFTAQASSNGFTCNANITDNVLPVCSTSICQVLTPTFFNFIVYPQACFGNSCLPNILVLDPSTSCNVGNGVCMPTGCKVRGSQDGENICAMIEDSSDYDWNDYSFSTKVTTFPSGDKLLRVYQDSCAADALDGLNITFNFSTPKYILDMHYGLVVNQNQEYFLWHRCDNSVGEFRTFFISNNSPTNLPPVWNTDALPPAALGDPYNLNPDPIAFGGGIFHDLWPVISDETLDASLLFSITFQSNPSIASCTITSNRFLNCTAAFGSGRSFVTIRAMDAQGAWSEGIFEVVVGAPKINLPNLLTIPVDGDWTIDLRDYSVDSSIFDVPQFSLVNEYNAFVDCKLEPSNYNLHCKYNRIAAKGSKGFSDFVLTGSSMFTSSTAVVEFRVQVI